MQEITPTNPLHASDLAALAKMKQKEASLSKRLVSRILPDGCIIATTKNRIDQLYEDLTK